MVFFTFLLEEAVMKTNFSHESAAQPVVVLRTPTVFRALRTGKNHAFRKNNPKTGHFGIAMLYGLFLLFWAGCSTEAALQGISGSSSEAPVFYGCETGADGSVSFNFSVPVTLESAYFDPPLEYDPRTNGETISFYFDTDLPGGERVTADLLVEDNQGNTLNVLIPFRIRNNRVPDFFISEIRTENSNMSTNKPRTEFVELYIQSAGNLGALRLYAAGNNSGKGLEAPIFEFPPVMVNAEEYVVIHTRTLPGQDGCRDETGSELGYSGGYEATPGRDFWIPGSAARLHNTDAIFIVDQDDRIIDGILLCEKEEAWKNDIVQAAKQLAGQNAWDSSEASSAVSTRKTTPARTVNRDTTKPDSNTAADWYIKESSNESPGYPNK
jgi:hypothetical protein